MLERTTRSYFEDILSKDFQYVERQDLISLENRRTLRRTLRNSKLLPTSDDVCCSSDERIMTRKTRTRRPRIPAIQSGYCAVCSVPYNSVEDHIQSKKHLKLIGEDANYIALNGSLNGFLHTSSIPFLNLNGIDAIGVHETSLEEFSQKYRRKNMPRTRAASVCDRVVKPSPLSPTGSDVTGHHLRSRRHINYMTPPLDDDSLEEGPDISISEKHGIEPVHHEYKEYRELRSSTRALAKLTEQISDHHEEVWNSGRPKRACIKQKRISADERLVHDNRTYYKVEVLSSKLRSSTHHAREQDIKRQQSQSPKREEDEKDKGLIVKFKKLRNSELIQLNNEATNFLFPKKDESSEDEDIDDDGPSTTASSLGKDESTLLSSDAEDTLKTPQKVKIEDEASMDSMCSDVKGKKRRRTHAEAFIMDNQKYYKFETPGSRLRYQGTYLTSVLKSPKHNGERTLKIEKVDKTEEPEEKMLKANKNAKVELDNYKFSFEKIPVNAPWYVTFQRLDKGEQRYPFYSDEYFWDPFILPYQMRSIPPLDRRICMHQYNQLIKCICDPPSECESTGCSTPEPSTSSNQSLYEPDIDEDSKMSATTFSSTGSFEEMLVDRKRRGRKKGVKLQQRGGGKNPRKSPRQHASTLAILSSLIQQRKRRSRNKVAEEANEGLPTIPEEEGAPQLLSPVHQEELPQQQEQQKQEQQQQQKEQQQQQQKEQPQQQQKEQPQQQKEQQQQQQDVQVKPKIPYGRFRPKIDYFSIARQIDNELDTALDDDLEDYELEIAENSTVDFHNGKMGVKDILRLYEEGKSKEDEKSCRRFFNGTPGRKPGTRRKKKNKTGWPNKNRRLAKKGRDKEKEEENDNDDSTIDSMSVNLDSEEEACDEDANSTDSIKKVNLRNSENKSDQALGEVSKEENCDVDRVEKIDKLEKILDIKEKVLTNRAAFQPYVCVQKLDSDKLLGKHCATPKRTNRRQRRMPGSPKSPRMLRRPRGRWYRER